MKFDKEYFDAGLYRVGTRCEKWDGMRAGHGADALPLWVADMDFASPPAVQEAILRRAAEENLTPAEVTDFAALPGNGLTAVLNGEKITGGSMKFIASRARIPAALTANADRLSAEGKTVATLRSVPERKKYRETIDLRGQNPWKC